MSKIKVLLAEEKNIDDLKYDVRTLVFNSARVEIAKGLEKFIREYAEIEEERTAEGYVETYVENYSDLIDEFATATLDTIVCDEHLDVDDNTYLELEQLVRNEVSKSGEKIMEVVLTELKEE